jgi:hypothetical protein
MTHKEYLANTGHEAEFSIRLGINNGWINANYFTVYDINGAAVLCEVSPREGVNKVLIISDPERIEQVKSCLEQITKCQLKEIKPSSESGSSGRE